MDFLFGLPRMSGGFDEIWIIVDRFTKTANFILIKQIFPLDKLARLYVNKILSQYGTPISIISYRDSRFTLMFGPKLQEALGTRLRFSTAFHQQINGEFERTIQTLEDVLRACTL